MRPTFQTHWEILVENKREKEGKLNIAPGADYSEKHAPELQDCYKT
jgi:hypothetical protein